MVLHGENEDSNGSISDANPKRVFIADIQNIAS